MSFWDNTQLNGMKKSDIVSKHDLQLKHKEGTLKTDRRKDQKDKKITNEFKKDYSCWWCHKLKSSSDSSLLRFQER